MSRTRTLLQMKSLPTKKVDGGVYITDCDDNVSSVNISKEVDGYAVIGVETNAFAECEKLKEVILPDSVKYMGESVFTGCTGLKKSQNTRWYN